MHGTEGSLIARDVMTQQPIGSSCCATRTASTRCPFDHNDLYVRALGAFHAAIRGEGQPAATGEDGIRSLAFGLAVAEAAKTGEAVKVETGL